MDDFVLTSSSKAQLSGIAQTGITNSVAKKIIFYPAADEPGALIDIVSRAAWFLADSGAAKIVIPVANESIASLPWHVADGMDSSIADKFEKLRQCVDILVIEEAPLRHLLTNCDGILCWKAAQSHWLFEEEKSKAKWLSGKKIWRVDATSDRHEGGNYIELGLKLKDDLNETIARNNQKFKQLANQLGKFEDAYVLATGPSVEHYDQIKPGNSLRVVCNSVILDEALMEKINPQLVVFADPIFHFGPSVYAAEFRQSLRRAAQRYDFNIIIPIKYHQIFLSSFPELEPRVIAIPFFQHATFNFDLNSKFEVKVTANILTFLMVPLATTFASKVHFLGCDGRPLNENTYFWKHNPKTQINDKMQNIQQVHPAFFQIDYNDYYTTHCELLDQQIREGEALGKRFVCMAHSHIPALKARMVGPAQLVNLTEIPAPRLLIVDPTQVGSTTATGQVKKRLLGNYPADRVLQIVSASGGAAAVMPLMENTSLEKFSNQDDLLKAVAAFEPEVVYYRPLDEHPYLNQVTHLILRELNLPLVTHIMDDWPAVISSKDPSRGEEVDRELRDIFALSHRVLSISTKMSAIFQDRYRNTFEPVANGINPDVCRALSESAKVDKGQRRIKILRYTGALAKNMTFDTILHIARVVDRLHREVPVRFEVYTMPAWRDDFVRATQGLKGVDVFDSVPDDQYEQLLSDADALVLGYNFDLASLTYIQHSLPNKLPEYLGSGTPVLAVGPAPTAVMELLAEHDLGIRITSLDVDELEKAIRQLAEDSEVINRLADKAQAWAFENMNIAAISCRFRTILSEAAQSTTNRGKSRSERASVDETGVVARMLEDRKGARHVMLDVGAHYGTSAEYFHKMGWTIHCFEPDPNNRSKLTERFGNAQNVHIDPRAVSDNPATGLQFFTSGESTGISGLHAFHETHAVTATVDATTITEIVKDRRIDRIDFLKIDVEGFDLSVLKGVPWDTLRPDVIECEFEDAKTLRLGHDWRFIADYLEEKGYTVYVSEWHPIVRYGIPHDWRRVVPFRGCELREDAWGNFIAFREDPGYEAVRSAFSALVKTRVPVNFGAGAAANPAAGPANISMSGLEKAATSTQPSINADDQNGIVNMLQKTPPHALGAQPSPGKMWYSGPAHKLQQISPPAFGALRFARRAFAHVMSRPHIIALLLGSSALTAWIGLDARFEESRGAIFTTAGLGLLGAALVYVAAKAQTHLASLHLQNSAVRAELDSLYGRVVQADQVIALREEAATMAASLHKQIAELSSKSTQQKDEISKLASEFGPIVQKLTSLENALSSRLDTFNKQLEVVKSEKVGSIEARIAASEKWSRFENSAWYQHFNRKLTRQHVDILTKEWSKRLSGPVQPSTLGYMANRACEIERQLEGRLATSIEDILLRSLVARAVRGKNVDVLEIGTLFGTGAAIMFDALDGHYEQIHFTLLDPLEGYYNGAQADILTGQLVNESVVRKNFARVGMREDQYTLIKHLSTEPEAKEKASTRKYDVLIIDGDHSYAGVKTDFEKFAPLVRVGGYIILDDYNSPDWPDVKEYVDKELGKHDFVAPVGATWRTSVYRVVKDAP